MWYRSSVLCDRLWLQNDGQTDPQQSKRETNYEVNVYRRGQETAVPCIFLDHFAGSASHHPLDWEQHAAVAKPVCTDNPAASQSRYASDSTVCMVSRRDRGGSLDWGIGKIMATAVTVKMKDERGVHPVTSQFLTPIRYQTAAVQKNQ